MFKIERFLSGLEDLNAKFKLVLFSDFAFSFMHDNLLSFLHSFTIAFFLNSKWRVKFFGLIWDQSLNFQDDVITFSNPLDINWLNYLHDLTPSFMLMSLDNANSTIFHNAPANLSRKLISIGKSNETIINIRITQKFSYSFKLTFNTGCSVKFFRYQFYFCDGLSNVSSTSSYHQSRIKNWFMLEIRIRWRYDHDWENNL